jgi:hypothetical protein
MRRSVGRNHRAAVASAAPPSSLSSLLLSLHRNRNRDYFPSLFLLHRAFPLPLNRLSSPIVASARPLLLPLRRGADPRAHSARGRTPRRVLHRPSMSSCPGARKCGESALMVCSSLNGFDAVERGLGGASPHSAPEILFCTGFRCVLHGNTTILYVSLYVSIACECHACAAIQSRRGGD